MLRKFDIFPKFDTDVRIKTNFGAIWSIFTLFCMFILFVHETYRFLVPRIFDEVVVDTSRVGLMRTMPITFNMSVYTPCSTIFIDAYDFEGNQQLASHVDIHKQRVDENGIALDNPEWVSIKKKEIRGREKDQMKKIQKQKDSNYCGSCYGAGAKGECCNSCDDVIDAFRAKNWSIEGIDRWEQCVKEGYTNFGKESCLVYGSIRVALVKGTFFLSAIDGVRPGEKKYHDISRLSKSLNLSHKIHYLEFGIKVPNAKHQLDGLSVIQPEVGKMAYTYHLDLVPTRWESVRKFVINTFKFTTAFNKRNITAKSSREVPGIYFAYDIAPLSVISKETKYSIWQYLTSLCAIIGGCFTCAALADQFLFRAVNTIAGKQKIGKDI